ncbi:glycerol kinase GlpK [Botrimarina sp.]|uniref:FGGY family carbohydrate kinase n=1 Tax=Botrimarina sp. TaxID=2795802 RepID=UPI0032EC7A9A
MTLLLAIDQSTSATKALLVDDRGAVLDAASLDHRQHYPRAGWVEHDAEEIWRNTLSVCRKLCERHSAEVAEVGAVCLTNQRETFLVFDRATGEPLAPAIVWQCRRGDSICEELRGAGVDGPLREKTGLRVDSYFSGPKITWLMRERPDLAARAREGAAAVSTVDAYLVHRLTGGEVYAADPTNASRTLLYDIRRRAWDDELCAAFEVPLDALPEVRDSTAEFGQTDLGGALPRPVPIRGVMGDSQASLFAQRCYAPGEAKATFGTGTSVLLNVGPEFVPPAEGAVGALAWVAGGEPTYAWEGLINYSAATLAWLKDGLGLIQSIDEVEPLAASVPDSDGVYLVPAFAGLSAPHWRPDARAAIVGMTGRTGKAHVVRAALESIALQVADVVEMLAASGARPESLRVDGGPTRNRLLMQMTADVARCELVATKETNLSALGAAMAGILGLGLVDSLDGLRELPRETSRYTPQADPAAVDKLLTGWRDAVAHVL